MVTNFEMTATRTNSILSGILIGDVTNLTNSAKVKGAYVIAKRVGTTTTYWAVAGR